MQYIIGQDDGTNIGPFSDRIEGLLWALAQLTDERVLPQYRTEAEALLAERKPLPPGRGSLLEDAWVLKAIDTLNSVDWMFFGIEIYGTGDLIDIVDELHLQAPDDDSEPEY